MNLYSEQSTTISSIIINDSTSKSEGCCFINYKISGRSKFYSPRPILFWEMLQYVAVFDPSRRKGEDDMHKQLLLYHSFTASETSLNDKLGRIGVIQGIWTLSESLNSGEKVSEKLIELDDGVILAIKVESHFFICLSVTNADEGTKKGAVDIPYQLYMTHIWYCYQFFTLQFGKLEDIEDSRTLTDLLNEHFVSFWNDIMLKPEAIIRRGITGMWPDSCKMAEFEINVKEESWESLINQRILLESESYLGIKDILVYHLPSENATQEDKLKHHNLGFKTYGLIRNFCADLEITAELSNWIYHKHAVYEVLSSHVLAGNTYYEEAPYDAPGRSEEANAGETEPSTRLNSDASFQNSLQEQGKNLLHNLTLPITFAYDAVQEVSSTAGISSSMSLFMDYVPKWGKSKNGERSADESSDPNFKRARYGYLISPLSSATLPKSYKIKTVKYRDKAAKESRTYNLIFWYYDDVLVVVVTEPNFSKIWDSQYLEDLSYKLRLSIECFYKAAFKYPEGMEKTDKKESFAYTILDKKNKTCRASIPPWRNVNLHNNELSPLKLVTNGVDQLFGSINTNSYEALGAGKWGITMMGGLFGIRSDNTTEEMKHYESARSIERTYENFLDALQGDKKWALQLQIIHFLQSLKNSQKKKNIIEERLLKLNNGILCYIKENEEELTIIIKNWYESEMDDRSPQTLFSSLGKDVYNRWNNPNS